MAWYWYLIIFLNVYIAWLVTWVLFGFGYRGIHRSNQAPLRGRGRE